LTILGRKAAIPNFYPKHAYENTFVFVAKHALYFLFSGVTMRCS